MTSDCIDIEKGNIFANNIDDSGFAVTEPFYKAKVTNRNLAILETAHNKEYFERTKSIAEAVNIDIKPIRSFGGYAFNDELNQAQRVDEISYITHFKGSSEENRILLTCLTGDLGFEVQDTVGYIKYDDNNYNSITYNIPIKKYDNKVINILLDNGIKDYTYDRENKYLVIIADNEKEGLIDKFVEEEIYEKSRKYQERTTKAIWLGRSERQSIYGTWLGIYRNQSGRDLHRNYIQQAIARNNEEEKIQELAKQNAINNANGKYTSNGLIVHNEDLGIDIIIGSEGLRHSSEQKRSNYDEICIATLNIGELLKNAIAINELFSRKKENGSIVFGNIMVNRDTIYGVRIIVTENSTFDSFDIYNLGAINTKDGAQGLQALNAPSTITIKQFLDIYKQIPLFSGDLSQDVKNKLGITEKSGLENIKYSKEVDSEGKRILQGSRVDIQQGDERGRTSTSSNRVSANVSEGQELDSRNDSRSDRVLDQNKPQFSKDIENIRDEQLLSSYLNLNEEELLNLSNSYEVARAINNSITFIFNRPIC